MSRITELITEIDDGNGITDVGPDSGATDRAASGSYEPEIITGYDTESPRTERIASDGDTGGPRRTRDGRVDGRTIRGKRGKYGTETATKTSLGLESFSVDGLLLGIHAMIASATKMPEIAITADQAKLQAESIKTLAAQYNHVINPKHAAWIQFCIVNGTIYGAMVFAINTRKEIEKRKPVAPSPVNGAPHVPFEMPVSERPGEI
jgi:hypothetical protein